MLVLRKLLSYKQFEEECLLRFVAVAKLTWLKGKGQRTEVMRDQRAGLSTMPVTLDVRPAEALVDEPVCIQVQGLQPQQPITLMANLQEQFRLVACAHYRADSKGLLDLTQHHSIGGTYTGCEPMGLFWSMRAPPGEKQNVRIYKKNILKPFEVTVGVVAGHHDLAALCAEDGEVGELLAAQTVLRWYKAKDVQRVEVREAGLRGTLFLPPGEGPFLGVIDLFGSAGGLLEKRAALLASRGFAAFALAFFAFEDLPPSMNEMDFDYLLRAVDWLSSHPMVRPTGIGVLGVSKGGELAQCMAMYHQKVKALVVINAYPSNTLPDIKRNGEVLCSSPNFEISEMEHNEDGSFSMKKALVFSAENVLQAWKNNARALYICAEDDQSVDPEGQRKVLELWPAEKRDRLTFVSYPGAGHLIEPPYAPHCYASFHKILGLDMAWGGNPVDHAKAQEDSWRRILKFLTSALNNSSL